MDKLLETAIDKMSDALKTYKNKQIDKAIELKKEADLLFDEYNHKVDKELVRDKCLYGDNINFGVINHVFNQNVKNNIHECDENKPYSNPVNIKQYTKEIKNKPNLLAQYNIYDKLTSKKPNKNHSSYIDTVMNNYSDSINVSCIEDDNRSLIKTIRSMDCDELIDIEDTLYDLYMLIGKLILTYNKPESFDIYVDTKEQILDTLHKLDDNEYPQEDTCELNQDELSLLNDLSSLDDYEQEERFNDDKEIILNDIKNKITSTEDEEAIEWKKIFNKIKEKHYDKETFVETISEFYNISSVLNETK